MGGENQSLDDLLTWDGDAHSIQSSHALIVEIRTITNSIRVGEVGFGEGEEALK